MIKTRSATAEAYKLIHEGALALADVECNGICIDVAKLDSHIETVGSKIKTMEDRFRQTDLWRDWKKQFSHKANLGSREQLAHMLFVEMELPTSGHTAGGKAKANEEALEMCDHPAARNYLRLAKMQKLHSTYLTGIRREVCGNKIHPFFRLHTTLTYRSSSDSPNFQNMPIRNPAMARWIRAVVTASPGNQLAEVDITGAEVKVAACYHKDPQMLRYINDKGTDMHRDMAAQIFKLPHNQVPKKVRQAAKGGFVFSQFYGDWYVACARNLWNEIARSDLKTEAGVCLYDHLRQNGIAERGACTDSKSAKPGTFEMHLKKVERDFWKRRFQVYGKWREDWWAAYQRDGYFDTLTGFHITGIYGRNSVTNYPIQGSAFHCLLWALVKLNRWLRKNRMKTKIIGQIHDSMLLDACPQELPDVLAMAKQLLCVELKKQWKWLIVPMEIDADVSPVDGSWLDKEAFTI
jgi:DNA polymerase-1